QLRVALKAVESARQAASAAAGSTAERAAHVGYHLIGRGRNDLEADVAYRPKLGSRLRRLVFRHSTFIYLGPITIITALLLAACATYLRRVGASNALMAVTLLLLMIPAADIGIAIVQRALSWAIRPRRLPRLDFSTRIPDDARTMVIVPT